MKKVHLIIHGFVQGVFFRAYVRDVAQKLNLKGYAKNLSDGTVEVVAEGPEEKIKELIEYCKKGPEAADVNEVDVKFSEAKNEVEGFEIK